MDIPIYLFSITAATLNSKLKTTIYIEKNDGSPYTGLAYNTSGLVCYYCANGVSGAVQLTLANSPYGNYAANGFSEVDAAHMPGLYVFYPNVNMYNGAGKIATFCFSGAVDMKPSFMRLLVLPFNIWSSFPTVNQNEFIPTASITNISNIEAAIEDNALNVPTLLEAIRTLYPQAVQLPPEV